MAEMTPDVLRDACKKNGGYAKPELNDQLFLHCRGFRRIANLEPYVNLKVLWLEQNGIEDIEGLDAQDHLVTLLLHNNAIRRIAGLNHLGALRTLNLSHNFITSIEGISPFCPLLESLQVSHNCIASLAACDDVRKLLNLSSLDLSYNQIEGGPDVDAVAFFAGIASLAVLYVQGNPLLSTERQFRRRMIVAIPSLTYLDDRPVFPEERRTVDAWTRGGAEAEAEERAQIRREKERRLTDSVQALATMAAATKDERERRTAEWEAQREVEREARRERQERLQRDVERLNELENDCRTHLVLEQDGAWGALEPSLRSSFDAGAADVRRADRQSAEVAAAQRDARALLEKEEQELLVASGPSELRRLFEELECHDDEVVARLEAEMQRTLAGIAPTAPSTQTEKQPAPPNRIWDQYERWEKRGS